jgi:hypothetical protein
MLKHTWFLLVIAAVFSSAASLPRCGRGVNVAEYQRWVDRGEPYSVAACAGWDPKQLFEEKKTDLELARGEVIKLEHLGSVAKAALEAGLTDEAKSYADQALALAAEDRFKNAPTVSFQGSAEGDAVFLGNLVLGRLALLRGDVAAAEKYLLLSGQIKAGEPTFWGPNMTLARELLKRHRSKVVLEFLEEVKLFWRSDGSQQADNWAGMIRAGKIPDDNLTYY